VLEGDSAGQIAATGILSRASGGVGVAMKAAGVTGRAAGITDIGMLQA
jgi:hypothetical protein